LESVVIFEVTMRKLLPLVTLMVVIGGSAAWYLTAETKNAAARPDANGASLRLNPQSMVVKTPRRVSARRAVAPNVKLLLKEDALFAAAKTGNVDAATELFNDMRKCDEAYLAGQMAKDPPDPSQEASSFNITTDQWIQEQRNIALAGRTFTAAKGTEQLCKGMGDVRKDGKLYRATLYAAIAGDAKAANCFVEGESLPDDFTHRPDIYQSYRDNSLRVAQRQIAAGNVDMVQILANFYAGIPGSMSSYVIPPDPARYYMYLRLLNIIAGSQSPAALGDQVSAARTRLDARSFATAEVETQHMFDEYFRSNTDVVFPRETLVCNDADL
jgi:hypothetical protein